MVAVCVDEPGCKYQPTRVEDCFARDLSQVADLDNAIIVHSHGPLETGATRTVNNHGINDQCAGRGGILRLAAGKQGHGNTNDERATFHGLLFSVSDRTGCLLGPVG